MYFWLEILRSPSSVYLSPSRPARKVGSAGLLCPLLACDLYFHWGWSVRQFSLRESLSGGPAKHTKLSCALTIASRGLPRSCASRYPPPFGLRQPLKLYVSPLIFPLYAGRYLFQRFACLKGFPSLLGLQRLPAKHHQLSFLQCCAASVAQRFCVGCARLQVRALPFWPSGLTLRSSGLAFSQPLILAVSHHRTTMHLSQVFLAFTLLLLAGCNQQALIDKFAPQEEVGKAKQLVVQLAAKDYGAIQAQLDTKLRTPDLQETLERLTKTIPTENPKSINIVGAQTFTNGDVTNYNLTFEYEYTNSWLLTNVQMVRSGSQLVVTGLHIQPEQTSLKELNRFSLSEKGFLHYVFLVLAVAIPLFVVYVLRLCYKTPGIKRKWLWYVFIAVGMIQFSLNWTTGATGVQPLSVLLLGASFLSSGPFAPVVLSFALPIGAISFLAKRQSLAGRDVG